MLENMFTTLWNKYFKNSKKGFISAGVVLAVVALLIKFKK